MRLVASQQTNSMVALHLLVLLFIALIFLLRRRLSVDYCLPRSRCLISFAFQTGYLNRRTYVEYVKMAAGALQILFILVAMALGQVTCSLSASELVAFRGARELRPFARKNSGKLQCKIRLNRFHAITARKRMGLRMLTLLCGGILAAPRGQRRCAFHVCDRLRCDESEWLGARHNMLATGAQKIS